MSGGNSGWTLVASRKRDGIKVGYYTGRAGPGWVDADPRELFDFGGEGGAAHSADIFNRMTAVHGLVFEVTRVGAL